MGRLSLPYMCVGGREEREGGGRERKSLTNHPTKNYHKTVFMNYSQASIHEEGPAYLSIHGDAEPLRNVTDSEREPGTSRDKAQEKYLLLVREGLQRLP